jgi:hypothetical protein
MAALVGGHTRMRIDQQIWKLATMLDVVQGKFTLWDCKDSHARDRCMCSYLQTAVLLVVQDSSRGPYVEHN